MDLRLAIQKEHSKKQCLKIADFVGDSPVRFKALVEVFLAGPYKVTQRAAWPLSVCAERYPVLALPHLNTILAHATAPGVHSAVKRNAMRLLQFFDIPKRHHGKVLDIAFKFLTDRKEAIAVRVFSMTVIARLTRDKPELRRELCFLLEDELPYAGAAFRSRASRVLKTTVTENRTFRK